VSKLTFFNVKNSSFGTYFMQGSKSDTFFLKEVPDLALLFKNILQFLLHFLQKKYLL